MQPHSTLGTDTLGSAMAVGYCPVCNAYTTASHGHAVSARPHLSRPWLVYALTVMLAYAAMLLIVVVPDALHARWLYMVSDLPALLAMLTFTPLRPGRLSMALWLYPATVMGLLLALGADTTMFINAGATLVLGALATSALWPVLRGGRLYYRPYRPRR